MNKKAKVENHKDKNHKDKGTENKTKEAILDSALKIFLAKGYEGTSVRMILEDAGVVTGSFYHFFKSKEDVFENVVERFLIQYQKQFAAIAADNTHSLIERLDLFMDAIEWNANQYFDQLQADQLHWTIQYALHKRTLQALVPSVEALVQEAIENREAKNPMGFDLPTLAAVLVNGVEAILHVRPLKSASQKDREQIRAKIHAYVTSILGIQTGK